MELINNFFYQTYFNIYVFLNKNLIKKESTYFLNEQIKEISLDFTNKDMSLIKYFFIREYKNIQNNPGFSSELDKITLVIKKIRFQIAIEFLSNQSLNFSSNHPSIDDYQKKLNYISEIKKSDKKEFKKLSKLLELKAIADLSKDLDEKISKKISTHTFVQLLVQYREDFLKILLEENKGMPSQNVVGSDDLSRAYEAFFLLQKNNQFSLILEEIKKECEIKELDDLISLILPYLAGKASITYFQKKA